MDGLSFDLNKKVSKIPTLPISIKREVQINDTIYKTNLDYDKKAFSLIKISLDKSIEEFKKLDQINSKYNHGFSLLTIEGFATVSRKNLAAIIRKAYDISNKSNLDYDSKINELSLFISKTLLAQYKLLIANNQYPNVNQEIFPNDIKEITDKVILKNEMNQYEIPALHIQNINTIKNTILKIMQKLPFELLDKSINLDHPAVPAFEYYDNEDTDNKNLTTTSPNDDDIIITKDNKDKILNEQLILGPKIKEKNEAQLIPAPGQGRKPVSKDGKIDNTVIYDTTLWPNKCK
jgi:hypothetical protein